MSYSAYIGFFLAFLIPYAAIMISSDAPMLYVNAPGFVIVLGGTIAATLFSFPFAKITGSFKELFQTISGKNKVNLQEAADNFFHVLSLVKSGKLADADENIKNINSPILRTATKMYVDGYKIDEIAKAFDLNVSTNKKEMMEKANVFITMAGFAPAFGMVGTLIGLINMLSAMGEDFSKIGPNMAVALITTFYGVIMSNSVFKPMANIILRKLEENQFHLNLSRQALLMCIDGRTVTYTRELIGELADIGPAYKEEVAKAS